MRGSLRVAVLAVATAAMGCHSAKPVAPAWPAPSTTAEDGGESIEPATAIASAVEKDDDDDAEEVVPAAEIVAKPGAAPAEPEKPATVSPPTQPSSDEVIMSEEIIIEIED